MADGWNWTNLISHPHWRCHQPSTPTKFEMPLLASSSPPFIFALSMPLFSFPSIFRWTIYSFLLLFLSLWMFFLFLTRFRRNISQYYITALRCANSITQIHSFQRNRANGQLMSEVIITAALDIQYSHWNESKTNGQDFRPKFKPCCETSNIMIPTARIDSIYLRPSPPQITTKQNLMKFLFNNFCLTKQQKFDASLDHNWKRMTQTCK